MALILEFFCLNYLKREENIEDELLITLSYTGTRLHTSWHALRDAYLTLGDIEGGIEGRVSRRIVFAHAGNSAFVL